jgi:predicted nucleic acid-binding protein
MVQTTSTVDETLKALDPGEQAAITLVQEIRADLLLIDERRGRQAARDRGLRIIGVIGILDDAAHKGLLDLAEAISQLQQTNFRVSSQLLQALLKSHSSKG